jgi:glycosyltransferase involved in cell wall biosynthesis
MKTVFHVITTLERGGAENQLLILAQEQIASGMEVHVAYLKGNPELKHYLISAGAKVHDDLKGRNPLHQALSLRKLIKGKNWIVHAHLPRAELVAFITPAIFDFFVTRHNCEPFFPGSPKWFSNLLARLVELRVKKVIAISKAVKAFMVQQGEIKKIEKVQVVYYGFNPSSQNDYTLFHGESLNMRLGTISRLVEQKDIRTMIDVFARYKETFPDSSLSILGEGHLEADLKIYAASLNLEDSVKFLGRSSNVYEFLNGIDIFLLTSKYEGFGMVLLEAMDAGVPIVASRNSSILEVLGANFPNLCSTGDVEDFTKKILALHDLDYRQRIVNIQKERLGLFSAFEMNNKLAQAYRSRI